MPSERLAYLAEKYFGNRCQVTLRKFTPRGFAIHHIREIENDVLRRNYPAGDKGREEYYHDLEPLIEKDPDRFALITNPIHQKLDHKRNGISRLKMDNRIRFCALALLTEHKR